MLTKIFVFRLLCPAANGPPSHCFFIDRCAFHGGFSSSVGDQKELPGRQMKHPSHCWGVCLTPAVMGWGALRTQSVSNPVLGKVPATVQPPCQRPHVPGQLPLSASLLKGRVYPSPSLGPTCLGCPEGSGLCETIMVVGPGEASFQHFSSCPEATSAPAGILHLLPFYPAPPRPQILLPSPNRQLFHSVSHISLFSLRGTVAWCLQL